MVSLGKIYSYPGNYRVQRVSSPSPPPRYLTTAPNPPSRPKPSPP